MSALYTMPDDVDPYNLQRAIVAMQTEAARLQAAGYLKEAEKWEHKAQAAQAELARAQSPQGG